MYYLPIKIDARRIHVCKLITDVSKRTKAENDGDDNIFPFQFINQQSNTTPVFEVFNEQKLQKCKFIAHGSNEKDEIIQYNNIYKKIEENKISLIFLGEKFNKESVIKNLLKKNSGYKSLTDRKKERFGFDIFIGSENSIKLNFNNSCINKKIQVEFILYTKKYDGSLLKFTYQFSAMTTSADNIFDGVLDFGSEATQMSFKRKGSKDIKIKLIDTIERYFDNQRTKNYEMDKNGISTKKNVYFQRDPNNDVWMRSNFGLLRTLPKFQHHHHPFAEKERSLIHILTNNDLNANNIPTIPNIKLSTLLDTINQFNIDFENVSDNPWESVGVEFNEKKIDIHRHIINQFIHILLLRIKQADGLTKNKYIHFKILFPNVFPQKVIHDILQGLYRDFDKILHSNDNLKLEKTIGDEENEVNYKTDTSYKEFYKDFKGIEIQAISESDAAFIGKLARNEGINVVENGKYLIADGGKGTLDLSILIAKNQLEFNSIFRAGIPASGNLISFAFIDTILTLFVGTDKSIRESFINDEIFKKDNKIVNDFISEIEKLKYRYSKMAVTNRLDENSLKSKLEQIKRKNDISELTRVLEDINNNEKTIGDYYGYIKQSLDLICDRFMDLVHKSGVPKKEITKVILTGRAFLFKDLLNEIDNRFLEYTITNEIIRELQRELNTKSLLSNLLSIVDKKYDNIDELKKALNLDFDNEEQKKLYERIIIASKRSKLHQYKSEDESDDLPKQVSLHGAFHNTSISINSASDLIGLPLFVNTKENKQPKVENKSYRSRFKDIWVKREKKPEESESSYHETLINEEFYFSGITLSKKEILNDKDVFIGGMAYSFENNNINNVKDDEKITLFFTGTGFIFKWKNGFTALTNSEISDKDEDLIRKSLFPYTDSVNVFEFKGNQNDNPKTNSIKTETICKIEKVNKNGGSRNEQSTMESNTEKSEVVKKPDTVHIKEDETKIKDLRAIDDDIANNNDSENKDVLPDIF